MKKINEKQLFFAGNNCLKLLLVAKLCVLLLICSIATVKAGAVVSTHNNRYVFSTPEPSGLMTDQQSIVTGTVKDAATGEALPGVSVMVKGTTIGVATDMSGRFSLAIPQREATIVFSFIGYATREIIATGGAVLNVSMSLEIVGISEVVVVGYGVQKKETVVGAITQISSQEIMRSAAPMITNMISGKLSGVLTLQSFGGPGRNHADIFVRGLSSWNSSAPLILVDGIDRDFRDMDPNEISTISVLKDASATAVFGARGANGVIIVTTKRGLLSRPKMNFSAYHSLQKATRVPPFIDSYTTWGLWNVAMKNEQRFNEQVTEGFRQLYIRPANRMETDEDLKYPNVDWYDAMFRPFSQMSNLNLNVTGGTEFVKYFLSAAYLYEGDYINYVQKFAKNDTYSHRLNYRANLDFSVTKKTTVSFNLGGDFNILNGRFSLPYNNPSSITSGWDEYNDNSFIDGWDAIHGASPLLTPAHWPRWFLEKYPDSYNPFALEENGGSGIRMCNGILEAYGNPYTRHNNGQNRRTLNTVIFGDFILKQDLDFITKGLSASAKAAISYYDGHLAQYNSGSFQYEWDFVWANVPIGINPWKNRYETEEIKLETPLSVVQGGMQINNLRNDLYFEGSLNYANTFGKHSVTGLALMNIQERHIQTQFPYYNASVVGRATYDYSRKYLFEANISLTGSERFAPGNRFGLFPSGAVGWLVSEEDFFKNAVPWMNRLKLRYSEGLVGSDYAASRWLYISEYQERVWANRLYDRVPFDNSRLFIYEEAGANKSAQWEEAHKRNIGIDMAFFNNQLAFTVELFDEQRSNMLLTPNNVTFLVGKNFKELNLGRLKKHGLEIEARFNKKVTGNLSYSVEGNFAFNEHRIVYKDDMPRAPEHQKAAGKPLDSNNSGQNLTGTGYYTSLDDIHSMVGTRWGINFMQIGDYMCIDYNADGKIDGNDSHPIRGTTYPPFTASLTPGLTFKNTLLSLMFTGNWGKYSYYGLYDREMANNRKRAHEPLLDYWSPTNPDAGHQTLHIQYGGTVSGLEDHYWRNSNFIRLREVYITHTFAKPGILNKAAGISGLQVYAEALNLFTITKLPIGDPEVRRHQENYMNFPLMRNIKFGIKFDF